MLNILKAVYELWLCVVVCAFALSYIDLYMRVRRLTDDAQQKQEEEENQMTEIEQLQHKLEASEQHVLTAERDRLLKALEDIAGTFCHGQEVAQRMQKTARAALRGVK